MRRVAAFAFLVVIAVGVSVVSSFFERRGPVRMSERHHRRHDTYAVNTQYTRSLAVAMLVTSILGVLLGYLCLIDVFEADPLVVMAFFDAFLVTMFVLWVLMCRYKVSLFDDQLFVTPFWGRDISVFYSDIDRMTWGRRQLGSRHGRSLMIWIGGEKVATIWYIVDIERILVRIDRFDAFPHGAKPQES